VTSKIDFSRCLAVCFSENKKLRLEKHSPCSWKAFSGRIGGGVFVAGMS
jgi:hypothetical protein